MTDRDTPVTALREALERLVESALDSGFPEDWIDPESSMAMGVTLQGRDLAAARAALASSDDVAGSGECMSCGHAMGLHYGPCSFLVALPSSDICGCVAGSGERLALAPTTEAPPKDAPERIATEQRRSDTYAHADEWGKHR
jgi:hypothetical protein